MVKLSVIIPCRNASSTIAAQLDALTRQTVQPWEVIIADNGSTDDTVAIAKQYQDRLQNLRIIDASQRVGPSFARNAGAKAATGDALAFCDADDLMSDRWVAAMTEALSRYDFVASRLEHTRLNKFPQKDGLQQAALTHLNPPFFPYASSCGLGIKRLVHERVNGFDEEMLCSEDVDYCIRVQQSGSPLHFIPNAVIHSRYRTTTKGQFKQSLSWGLGFAKLYKKHAKSGMPTMPWKEALRDWLGFFSWLLRSLTRGDWQVIWFLGWRLGWLKGCVQHRIFAFVTPWPSKAEIRRQVSLAQSVPLDVT